MAQWLKKKGGDQLKSHLFHQGIYHFGAIRDFQAKQHLQNYSTNIKHLPSRKLTAKAPENRPKPKMKGSSSNYGFSEAMLVLGRVSHQNNFVYHMKSTGNGAFHGLPFRCFSEKNISSQFIYIISMGFFRSLV